MFYEYSAKQNEIGNNVLPFFGFAVIQVLGFKWSTDILEKYLLFDNPYRIL